jgi:enamine deaminase RidA (YjgF/YER057c/UK114 family)
MASSFCLAQSASPNGVKTLDPPGAIKAEGTWSLGARAGDFIFVAGMQGIDPATNTLVQEPQARIRQALLNIRLIAQSQGAKRKLNSGVNRHIHRARWSKSDACLTMTSWKSTASSTPHCESKWSFAGGTNLRTKDYAQTRCIDCTDIPRT